MTVNAPPGVAPGVGQIVDLGFRVAKWINRGRGFNAEQQAAADAASRAGYRHTRQGWIAPDGGRVLERTVLERGRQIIAAGGPGTPGYIPDLTETPRPTTRPSPDVTTRPRIPRIPGRFGRIVENVATIAAGSAAGGAILEGVQNVLGGGTTATPAPIPRPQPSLPPPQVSDAELVGGNPVSVFGRVPITIAQPRPAPVPRQPREVAPPKRPADTESLVPLIITAPYVPIPAPAPAPAPAPGTSTTPTTRSAWLNIAGAALLPYLFTGGQRNPRNNRLVDPLTALNPGVANYPGLGLQPFPGSYFGGVGGGGRIGTDQCSCPPKRKRKSKPRTVCYSGTYTERAKGLTKRKGRKVPCR